MHGERRVEQRNDSSLRPVFRGCARPDYGGGFKKARLRWPFFISENFERVAFVRIDGVLDGQVFAERNVAAVELCRNPVRCLLLDLQRVCLAGDFEILHRVGRGEFQRDGQMRDGLRAVCVRPQRNGEQCLQLLGLQALLVFQFHALGTERRDGDDMRAEDSGAIHLVGIALAHLQQARIDGLHLRQVVNFSRLFTLQNHAWDAGNAVPDGETGNQRAAGKSERVVSFQHGVAVAGEDLPRLHTRVMIVDANTNVHLGQRKHRRIGLSQIRRNQHACFGEQKSGSEQECKNALQRFASVMRTRPLSVPT